MTISRSPERGSFGRASYQKKLEENPDDENAKGLLELEAKWRQDTLLREETAEWQENNLEYELRSTDWILEKVRSSDVYAQNLYAAFCNNDFQKRDVMPILKDQTCSYSWRYAGGIIADMRQEGDYIDWYCSGIREAGVPDNGYVSESTVTDEIRDDLERLGWNVLPDAGEAY